ncbi:PREDICTED: fatty acid-binding protein-like [Papilio polytes]|uniref:fatty acid-binding protein-like n=1 Tax=Papilio polytes TaxID=76194 RepID=UPI0006761AD4|nr:PREDICTED: fatty acid-binding protein-like [Papilio polytes]
MAFEGKLYVHERDDNFDGFIASLGLPEDKVERLKNYKPNHKLEKNGDTYTMSSLSESRNHIITFKLGEEFDETVVEGRTAKTTFTLDGNTLTQVQKFAEGTITTKREYSSDKLVVTINRSNWDGTATRYYKV